jgi:hypothetical protein
MRQQIESSSITSKKHCLSYRLHLGFLLAFVVGQRVAPADAKCATIVETVVRGRVLLQLLVAAIRKLSIAKICSPWPSVFDA